MISPSDIKQIRVKAGFTQKEMADKFGYSSVRTWQKKEETGKSASKLSHAEEQYFLLITGFHESKRIVDK